MAAEPDICDRIAAAELLECGPLKPLMDLLTSDPDSCLTAAGRINVKGVARALGISHWEARQIVQEARDLLEPDRSITTGSQHSSRIHSGGRATQTDSCNCSRPTRAIATAGA